MRISAQDLFNRDYSIYRDKLNNIPPATEQPKVTSEDQGSKQESISPIRERLETKEVVDYAQNKGLAADPSLIGTEKSLESLDIEKAMSTMQKDKVLQQYNFFVGDINASDGFMIRKQ